MYLHFVLSHLEISFVHLTHPSTSSSVQPVKSSKVLSLEPTARSYIIIEIAIVHYAACKSCAVSYRQCSVTEDC